MTDEHSAMYQIVWPENEQGFECVCPISRFRPSSKNDLARGFLARLHAWSSCPDVSGGGSGYSMECGEQNFYFQAQKLSTLEAHHLQDFSTDTAGDAISRESQVLAWTNVVDAEDWMVETPDRNWTSAASWPQLLQRIAVMGPDIPQKSKACWLSAGVWMWGQFTLVFWCTLAHLSKMYKDASRMFHGYWCIIQGRSQLVKHVM